ncbi:MAG: MoxR family ATPase [Spirochaetaceae bacterium]|nr:MoxR family ATPase [Spirochaetaceae bacterium]
MSLLNACKEEVSKRVVGQKDVVEGILVSLLVGGHVLLEGVPGLAKTLLVKTISDISGLSFKRIQFTPDLLPADVTGTLVYQQGTGKFSVRKGPVFANLVLADEINRAPAKVQSALLEAMAEGQVTIGEETYKLPSPFFVLATQNPIEQEGTYNLPEAELDRFLMKLLVSYPSVQEEVRIIQGGGKQGNTPVTELLTADRLSYCRQLLDRVACDEKIVEYMVSIVAATRPAGNHGGSSSGKAGGGRTGGRGGKEEALHRYISFGASPRAGIALFHCAKAQALLSGRDFVLPEDVKAMAIPVLRHRLVLSYEAAAEGVTTDDLIARILSLLPLP